MDAIELRAAIIDAATFMGDKVHPSGVVDLKEFNFLESTHVDRLKYHEDANAFCEVYKKYHQYVVAHYPLSTPELNLTLTVQSKVIENLLFLGNVRWAFEALHSGIRWVMQREQSNQSESKNKKTKK